MSESDQISAGFCIGFENTLGISVFGDCAEFINQDPGWSELFFIIVSAGRYQPWGNYNGTTLLNEQNKYGYTLEFLMIIAAMIIIPEFIIIARKIIIL